MQFIVQEDALELEGTQRTVIRTNNASDARMFPASGEQYALLRNAERVCGGLVDIVEDNHTSISLDKYLRIYLQARVGSQIIVEPYKFPVARSIEFVVPTNQMNQALHRLVHDTLIGKPFTVEQSVSLFMSPITGDETLGEVTAIDPPGIAVVSKETEIKFKTGRVSQDGVTYDSVGGLNLEIEKIREIVEYPLRYPDVFQQFGVTPPRGIILHGPPGTGKTLIAKALAHEIGASVYTIQGPEIISAWYGGSEHNLRLVFEQAKAKAPAIILIDEIDSIAPRRDRIQGEVEHRVVAMLLTLMDGLSELKDVVVIGTTNTINSMDPALRRPGRFEYEILVGVPDTRGRREILSIHTRRMPLSEDVNLDSIADKTYGFVGADISSLCRQAAYQALRRIYSGRIDEIKEHTTLVAFSVTPQDFETALLNIKPSAMREFMVEVPRDVSWNSIGGLDDIKTVLIENIIYGIRRRETFLKVGIKPAKGMVLSGAPGTGKTLLAKVIARESGANVITVRGPEIRSKWFGESEERIRLIFAKAREVAPCILLFDEIDAVAPVRGRDPSGHSDSIVNQLLAEMDGIEKNENIFVIGTTNKPELLDSALLRPGRLDYQIFVPLPDTEARRAIFSIHLKDKPVSSDLSLDEIIPLTEGLSGADIAEICRLATLAALRDKDFTTPNIQLELAHLQQAIAELNKTKAQLKKDYGL